MHKKNISIIIFLITLLIWCTAISYPVLIDYDIWARLIAGKSIFENGIILKDDFLSYTQTHLWLDHEWGASVILYWWSTLSNVLNKPKLEIFNILKIILTFSIITLCYLCVFIKKPKYSTAHQILYFALVLLAANIVFTSTIRCHLFTYLFFTFWILILELYRIYNKKFLLSILPITMILWCNIHGGCLSGLGLIIIYTIGEFFNRKDIRPYMATLIVSLLVLFINPYGIDYVKFLFTAGTMNRHWISEWQSPFTNPDILYAIKFKLYFIFVTLIVFFQTRYKKFELNNIDKTKILLIIITAIIAILHTKLIAFFVISSAIFMFDDVFFILKKIKTPSVLSDSNNKIIYILILILSFISINLWEKEKYITINERYYPFEAVKFLQDNNIKCNLFVEMTYGSYCAYKLYPQNKIFMDGRYEEVYNPDLINIMKDFIKQEGSNPNSVLTDYPTDIVLLYKPSIYHSKLVDNMIKHKWKQVYNNTYWIIFLKPNYKEIKLRKKQKMDKINIYKNLFETNITKQTLLSLNLNSNK